MFVTIEITAMTACQAVAVSVNAYRAYNSYANSVNNSSGTLLMGDGSNYRNVNNPKSELMFKLDLKLFAEKNLQGSTNQSIPKAEELKLSETVKNHLNDTVSKDKIQIIRKDSGHITIQEVGDLTRPYINSNQTIQSIIDGGIAVKDSILNNGLKWNIPGTFRGTTGTWELVVDMDSNTIVHFLFYGR